MNANQQPNGFPKLHNAMWPGVVGKGSPGAEPCIDLDTMLDLTAKAEVNGVKFDGVDLFLFDPHVSIDISDDGLKAIADKIRDKGFVVGFLTHLRPSFIGALRSRSRSRGAKDKADSSTSSHSSIRISAEKSPGQHKSGSFSGGAYKFLGKMSRGFFNRLRQEAIWEARRHNADIVSEYDVKCASQRLLDRSKGRFSEFAKALGGILLGAFASNLLGLTDQPAFSTSLLLTIACGVCGASILAALLFRN